MAAANPPAPAEKGTKTSKNFARDLPMMMYGFGDDPFPLSETIKLVEEFARDYVERLVSSDRVGNWPRDETSFLSVLSLLVFKNTQQYISQHGKSTVYEITNCIVAKTLNTSNKQISTEAVLFAVRKDPVKYRRVKELLHMQKQVKKVLAEANPNVAAPENAKAAIAKQENEPKRPAEEHSREVIPPAQPAKSNKPKPKRARKQNSGSTPPKPRKKPKT